MGFKQVKNVSLDKLLAQLELGEVQMIIIIDRTNFYSITMDDEYFIATEGFGDPEDDFQPSERDFLLRRWGNKEGFYYIIAAATGTEMGIAVDDFHDFYKNHDSTSET